MTPQQIRDAITASPEILALLPDTYAIAGALQGIETEIIEYWLTDRGLITDLYTSSGSTTMSDSVLSKLEAFAASSKTISHLFDRLCKDTRGLDFGQTGLRGQIQYLGTVPGGFSAEEVAALLALAERPVSPTEFDVRCAIFADDGSLLV